MIEEIKAIVPEEGGIVLIKVDDLGDPELYQVMKSLANEILENHGVSVTMIATDDMNKFNYMNEKRMEELGWVKKDKVLMMKDDALKRRPKRSGNTLRGWSEDQEEE